MRKGLMKGKGRGYKNVVGRDPLVHSQSRRGIKQPQKVSKRLICPILTIPKLTEKEWHKEIKGQQKHLPKMKKALIKFFDGFKRHPHYHKLTSQQKKEFEQARKSIIESTTIDDVKFTFKRVKSIFASEIATTSLMYPMTIAPFPSNLALMSIVGTGLIVASGQYTEAFRRLEEDRIKTRTYLRTRYPHLPKKEINELAMDHLIMKNLHLHVKKNKR